MSKQMKFDRAKKLFLVFFRIGAFTFGGGYAMIPFIQKEIVEKNQWIEEEDIVDIFAIVQSVPGVIAVNSSIFVGYRVAGILGALAAVVGVILPSYIIIALIAYFFYQFKDIPMIANAFEGIRAGVVALIVFAIQKLGKPSIKDTFGWITAILAFIAASFTGVSAFYILLTAAVSGFIFKFISQGR